MTQVVTVILALFFGGLLGAIFFGGLWWTVRMGLSVHQPGIVFAGSFLLRTLLCVAGFYFIANGDWQRLAASVTDDDRRKPAMNLTSDQLIFWQYGFLKLNQTIDCHRRYPESTWAECNLRVLRHRPARFRGQPIRFVR